MNRVDVLVQVCETLKNGSSDEARRLLEAGYPFQSKAPAKRQYTQLQSMRLFLRDGFVDRYTGERLLNPAVLAYIGTKLPDAFPMHPNWKMSESHIAFWELSPTVDHVVPVARGGVDSEENWVTTSMLRNQAKGHWLLEELGWELHPPGQREDWDGMSRWILEAVSPEVDLPGDNRYLENWYRATEGALSRHGG